jgi:steroid 5-alpha reductase family enzyme
VDVFWSFGVGGVGCVGALMPLGSEWPQSRQWLVVGLAGAWCLRLGLHIASRTRAAGDDPRYRALIEQWGSDAPCRMFCFLQAQAAVGLVLVLSIILAAHNPDPNLRIQDVLGLVIFGVAIAGEAAADRQLRAFRADPAQRGKVCDAGLWRWSRHPNYFFEWLSWVAYPIIAIDFAGHNPFGWLAIAAPVCMYWVLVYVSGIPPLEEHMLRSRGEMFRTYQQRTSAFFPLPRR